MARIIPSNRPCQLSLYMPIHLPTEQSTNTAGALFFHRLAK